MFKEITFRTSSREEAVDITDQVQAAIAEAGVDEGFVFIYVPHSTAAVSIHARGGGHREGRPHAPRGGPTHLLLRVRRPRRAQSLSLHRFLSLKSLAPPGV